MAGPNILVADQSSLGAGNASAFILSGGRFATQIGQSLANMRSKRTPLGNALAWFKGRLYWCSSNNAGVSTVYIYVYDQATDTWSLAFSHTSGFSPNGSSAGGIFVVGTGSTSYLVVAFRETTFGNTGKPGFIRTPDGTTWTVFTTGGNLNEHPPRDCMPHAGLLFVHRRGPPNNPATRTSFDPVTGTIAGYTLAGSIEVSDGEHFKFDGRFYHIACTEGDSSFGFLEQFTFGTWNRLTLGTGYAGDQIYFGRTATTDAVFTACAVQIDDATVILFGTGDAGGGQGLRAYQLTLSGGSGSTLLSTDVTSTYVPVALAAGTAIGDPFNYEIHNLGKGADGFWYLSISVLATLTGVTLLKVSPGGELADAGAMNAFNSYALPTSELDGGSRMDFPGSVPLIKPSPLSTTPGPTGLVQSFRVDGDPLVALHGAVAGPGYAVGEAVTWIGGSGIVLAGGVGAAELQLHTIAGVVPDGLIMSGGTSGSTSTCSTSSGNGQAHTVRGIFFLDANNTGLGPPNTTAPSGYCTMVAGSGVNCTVSKGTGPDGSDEVITDADGSGQVKSFEWDFLDNGVGAFSADNVKLQASRV